MSALELPATTATYVTAHRLSAVRELQRHACGGAPHLEGQDLLVVGVVGHRLAVQHAAPHRLLQQLGQAPQHVRVFATQHFHCYALFQFIY